MVIQTLIQLEGIGVLSMTNIRMRLLSLIILMVLVGCSSEPFLSKSYSTSFNLIFDLLQKQEIAYTSEQIENIPFASSIISFNGNKRSLIILESQNNKENTWVSSDFIRFKEFEGRIIQTIGLPNDLYSINRSDISFETILGKKNIDYIAYYSFKNPDFNNLKVNVNAKVKGVESVQLLNGNKNLTLIEESIYAEAVNWKAINRYWIDGNTNFVWKSVQSISPNIPPIELEVTKKPAR